MKKTAIVVSSKGKEVTLLPLLKEGCASCTVGCDKRGNEFTAINPNNYQLKPGTIVTVGISPFAQGIQGLLSLFVPVVFAVLGYFIASPLAKLFGKTAGEGFKALMVIVLLFISSGIIYLITAKHPLPGKLMIQSLIDENHI